MRTHTRAHLNLMTHSLFFFSSLHFIEIFDVMIEGQQFEFLGFTLNPVIRMAIMRKVCIEVSYHFSLLVRNGATLINLESAEML